MSLKKASTSGSRRVVCIALSAAALSLFAANVYSSEAPREKVVRYADLDLAKQQDAEILYARLERAASVVCRDLDSREIARWRMKRACERRALSAAVEEVDNARVTALHNSGSRVRLAKRGAASAPRT